MGYMRHHAIVVSSWNDDVIEAAHAQAVKLFSGNDIDWRACPVSEIVASPLNGYRTFIVAPDGSKEGWDASVLVQFELFPRLSSNPTISSTDHL